MKNRIDNIYNDNQTLFTNNNLINSDERLTSISAVSEDLDLITEMSFGNREILLRYLTENTADIYKYNLPKIHKSIYATIIENMVKYETMLEDIENVIDYDPTKQFYEKDIIGDRVREQDMASRVDTTTHGTVNNTRTFGDIGETTAHGTINNSTTYGQVTEQNTVGQTINTMQNGARENTGAVTSFSSSSFENTNKTTSSQVTDTQTLGSHTDTLTTSHATPDVEQITQGNDTVTTTHGNDTEQITRGNDSVTHGAHKDVITDTESIDEKFGYSDYIGNLEKRRKFVNQSVLKEIVNDCVNSFSYGLYLF